MASVPRDPRPFRAVLFDLDDTLYDRGAAFAGWADEYLRRTCGMADDTEQRRARARIAALDAGGYGSKKAVLEEVCRLYPPSGVSARTETTAGDFYDDFFTRLVLDADAAALLAALEGAGVPWGVVTNGRARQWRKLEQMGLTGRTPCLFVSETFGRGKPDSAIFLAAADCLGVPPGDVLFVGDHPRNDIVGARDTGMSTAWLPRGKPWPADCGPAPRLTLGGLADLLPLLPAAGAQRAREDAEKSGTGAQEVCAVAPNLA